ncbi:hypothetical protein KIN20_023893 [Parelaphostrongylus tenuis]|uniref:Uncharacterized protein n=1 Tax=Parelaphostrongylus tenuis TaxID=148309 RepID=A0AAD5QT94_PARTN|nr:hypothetical protein KIN20_023893 [Parelaphostrongylus tenuis]
MNTAVCQPIRFSSEFSDGQAEASSLEMHVRRTRSPLRKIQTCRHLVVEMADVEHKHATHRFSASSRGRSHSFGIDSLFLPTICYLSIS